MKKIKKIIGMIMIMSMTAVCTGAAPVNMYMTYEETNAMEHLVNDYGWNDERVIKCEWGYQCEAVDLLNLAKQGYSEQEAYGMLYGTYKAYATPHYADPKVYPLDTPLSSVAKTTTTHSHTWILTSSTASTCLENGVETYVCDCGESKTVELPLAEHDYQNVEVIKEGTCTERAVYKAKCTVCGDEKEIEGDFGSHEAMSDAEYTGDESVSYTIEATCTEKGRVHKVCKNCGEVMIDTETPAKGHTGTMITVKEATCTEDGLMIQGCSECNYRNEEVQTVIKATGHKEKEVVEKATLFTPKKKETVCEKCGEVLAYEEEGLAYIWYVGGAIVLILIGTAVTVIIRKRH